jgi:SAM-dependent methyltransferase
LAPQTLNEVTFVGHLGTVTGIRAERIRMDGGTPLIVHGEVEERQVDPKTGRVLRCDIRLNAASGRKLASGEMKRPEVPEGRDVLNESLLADARRKAIARGLPYYFTCNMREVALFEVASRPGEADTLQKRYDLADIEKSSDAQAVWPDIDAAWSAFLDDLEDRLRAVETRRPSVTTGDVVALQQAIDNIAEEAIDRTADQVVHDSSLADTIRSEAAAAFGFSVALNPKFPVDMRRELLQILRLGAFVIAQKLVLYRVLGEVGPLRESPFELDPLAPIGHSTDPADVADALRRAAQHAIRRSRDYETAFNPRPLDDAVFVAPRTDEQTASCRVGEVWQHLLDTISGVSWASISQNLVGFLYEAIVDPEFRHLLGQHYTREDVVDLLVAYAIPEPGSLVLDPATGGGSFLRAAYNRKTALGDSHEQALAEIWGCEIAAFAAELSTIMLATANTREPAAYPRVILRDFFDVQPDLKTELQIPGEAGELRFPAEFDAVIGNPPYISYRHQTNQRAVARALRKLARTLPLPLFSGKSDEYVWFLVHATRFLRPGGRLGFVVSSAILFADYGVPLIRFLARHYKIHAVIDSAVERWFVDADTNTVLLMLERCEDESARSANDVRFVRLRKPLARLLPTPDEPATRRQATEDLIEEILAAPAGSSDPRMLVTTVPQGDEGGMSFTGKTDEAHELELEDE